MDKRRKLFEERCLTLNFFEALPGESSGVLLIVVHHLVFGVAIRSLAEIYCSEWSYIALVDLCLREFHHEEVSRIHAVVYCDPYFGHIIDYFISLSVVDTLSTFDQVQQIEVLEH